MSKKKIGRPKKYDGEKNVQLSVTIRPRYRQALELIAKDRETTLSESLELAIYKLASTTNYDNKIVMDLVRPKDEILQLTYDAISPASFFSYLTTNNENIGSLTRSQLDTKIIQVTRTNIDKDAELKLFSKLKNKPTILLTPLESYTLEILNHQIYKHHLYDIQIRERLSYSIMTFFDEEKILNLIEEGWRIDLPAIEIINSILAVELFLLSTNLLIDEYIKFADENLIDLNDKNRNEESIQLLENFIQNMPLPRFEKVKPALLKYKEIANSPEYADAPQLKDII